LNSLINIWNKCFNNTKRKLPKNIEIILYLCPGCNNIGTIKSIKNRFYCDCGLDGVITRTGKLEGDSVPYSMIEQWEKWQTEQLTRIIGRAGYEPLCIDENQQLYAIYPKKKKVFIAEGRMFIDHKLLHCAGVDFPLESITGFAVKGQSVLLFAGRDGMSYEVHSKTPRSALKYIEIFKLLTGE